MSFRPGLGRVALVVSVLLGAAAELRGQGLVKETGQGFRLFARAESAIRVNRVNCPVASTGELCAHLSHLEWGGEWPRGSSQFYVWNSGLQVAGVVEAGIPGFDWSGDTTGAFFYDDKGTTQHGREVEPIWNHVDPEDRASWPAMARVGASDPDFSPSLRGRASASEGDLWSMMWEGDTALMNGRPHPLGIAVETRVLGWNYPSGNQDIVYFVHTLYNVTSSCAADYAGVRPELRDRLIQLGQRFQAMNNARFGITIPACGYDIAELYVGSSSDHDVSSDGGSNYGSVNLPLAMGYSYNDVFPGPEFGYLPPPELRTPPFLNGFGLVGTKFLGTSAATPEAAIALYTVFTGGGIIGFPQNSQQLWRYLGGRMDPALGDGSCNQGTPLITRVCYIKSDVHHDTHAMQSTGPTLLAPGGTLTIATAYLFASAVGNPGCPVPNCGSVGPGDVLRLVDPVAMASGANLIDSMTGYRGYVDDNGDGVVQGREFRAVRGSLIHKAQLAQEIFDRGFLLPTAPAAPDFFLVPGDDQVAILWRPSATESTGDPYFTVANDPDSPAYDPNYRQFDTEGYRIYRGRVDDPSRLTLVAQYDHGDEDSQGHPLVMRDHLGAVNPGSLCAPELGRNTAAEGCEVDFDDPPSAGTAYTAYLERPIYGLFVQVRLGDRFLDASGTPYVVRADTLPPPSADSVTYFENAGVPFVHVDTNVRNNLRYFYTVTAFDVNSLQSGPSSLESARVLKATTPMAPASNYVNDTTIVSGIFGRGVAMSERITVSPRIIDSTGVFTGPARPATGASIRLLGSFIAQLVTASGELSLTLDSMAPGSAYDNAAATYWFRATQGTGSVSLPISVVQSQVNVQGSESGILVGPPFSAERITRYGGSGEYRTQAMWEVVFPGNYYTAAYGRGCVNGAPGFSIGNGCDYNGARWFDDSTEVFAHPTQGNNNNFANELVTNRTNAGALAGVAHVYEARAYQTRPNVYRTVEGVLGTIATAADYRVWWGANGSIDSVVDITHNVRVPFKNDLTRGYTWGFLTEPSQAAAGSGDARIGVISVTDFGCVEPLRSYPSTAGHLLCASAAPFTLDNTLGPTDFAPLAFGNTTATDASITPTTNQGFGMYIAGHLFLFEMNSPVPAAPPAGTLWTLRTYVGAISGGSGGPNGTGNNFGGYYFMPQPAPLTAVGASLKVQYTITNGIHSTTREDLSRVHTIPDPYYLTNGYESSADQKVIKFVNLPDKAIIRIYTLSGILVRVIEHNSSTFGGQADWDVRNNGGRLVASGVYFYHVESTSGARRVGRMTLVTDGR